MQREVYETQAKEIDRIQKEILDLSRKEEPYDIFICYKETDDSGKRTQDSVIANEIYYELVNEGFKVFYAAISLEDKLGTAYEPCIFAALTSAKVMLAIGTKPEYFNAVWVKNEWSRFLKMMRADRSKVLIPCYKDMVRMNCRRNSLTYRLRIWGKLVLSTTSCVELRRSLRRMTIPILRRQKTRLTASFRRLRLCWNGWSCF